MPEMFSCSRGLCVVIAVLLMGFVREAIAHDVALAGLMGSRAALLVVNGGKPQTVQLGKASFEGVEVIRISPPSEVVVKVGSDQRTLRLGEQALRLVGVRPQLLLEADAQGHFFVEGAVNGAPMRFLIDTGATLLSMSRADAIRARLDLDNAQPITTMTADGPVRSWKVRADEVRVGGVIVQKVDVSVLEASLPMVLLGMSFLTRVELRQDGRQMTLTTRQ
jgi:aspartyl protease family protein